jgi:predicted naringenin-chalcone synthase
MSVTITCVAKALPRYSKETPDILPFLDLWLLGKEERFVRKVKKIFESAGVDKRYSVMDPEQVFSETSFEQRNRIYAREAISLGRQCLEDALQRQGWMPDQLDYIITVSCTGIMIPSLDAYLINALRLRKDIIRLPVTEMGCAAGVSGIIYANNFLKAHPGKRAAVIAVESPTATFQLNDYSMTNVVSAAIFGDGAACVLLSSCPEDKGPRIIDEQMYHFYDAERMMGFDLTDSGLKMILDIEVPETITAHFDNIIIPFLSKSNKTVKDIDHLIFHPGGRKIMQAAESFFESSGKDIHATRAVMKQYGNMSSATVLYVLEHFLEREQQPGTTGLMLSFGPGFSAQSVLLQW